MKTVDQMVEASYSGRPERVLQFGEGNFLRAFVDWMIDKANQQGAFDGSVVVCQPIPQGATKQLAAQDCVYTVIVRGRESGKEVVDTRIVTSISRCVNPYEDYEALLQIARSPDLQVVVSNTTEAGIAYHAGDRLSDRPAVSYPAKLTAFLYERYKAFEGKGGELLVIPCELIDNNGKNLHALVRRYAAEWELEGAFLQWLAEYVHFTGTLVDRLVTGFPKGEEEALEAQLGYKDSLMVVCEPYHLFAIEGKQEWAGLLPIHKAVPTVVWTDDVSPYKLTKVRILNGSHTASALAGYLAGNETVLEVMANPGFRRYIHKLIYDEIIPVTDVPKAELDAFAKEVEDRYDNPFLKHRLLDISLNSCAKFNARCLPTLLGNVEKNGIVPPLMSFALAGLIAFYNIRKEDEQYYGTRPDGTRYRVVDDDAVLAFFADQWSRGGPDRIVHSTLANQSFWSGKDLTGCPGLEAAVAGHLQAILTQGVQSRIDDLTGA